MKKFDEILQEIEKAKKAHSTTAGDAYEAFLNGFGVIERITARKAGDEEFLKREEDLRKKACAEGRKNEEDKIKIAILTQNAKRAFFAENIGKICEIWNSYAGKKYGEKTAEKIRAELETATGAGVWICNKYNETQISIYLRKVMPNNEREINAYIRGYEPTDNENKIKPIDADAVRLYWCGAYVDDIPAHIRKFYKAREDLKKAEENAKKAREVYNDLARGNMRRADTNGAPNWVF